MSPSIRLARPDERAALEALQFRASTEHPDYRQQILDNPEVIVLPPEQIDAGQVAVVEGGGAVKGFAVVLPREDGQAELDGLFVEPRQWRGGFGRALVDWASDYAAGLGASRLCVVANPTALDFYRAVGFVQTGEMETQFDRAPVMEKMLTPPKDR